MNTLTDQIPVVTKIIKLFPADELKDVFILACQHLLLDAHLLLCALQSRGLQIQNVAIMGKCYSTSQSVVKKMKAAGFDVFIPDLDFDSHLSFDEQFNDHVKKFLQISASKYDFSKFKRVIVLDDGGELINATSELFGTLENFVGVEQTSGGFNKLKDANLKFPVVNVARSKSKLTMESPFVARIILERLELFLNKNRLSPKNCLIIGNGFIGKSIHEMLIKKKLATDVYDLDGSLSNINQNSLESCLGNSDIVIGCTGHTSVRHEQHAYFKKNCILVSASSSDREFDAVYLRRRYPKTYHCHLDMNVNGLHLLNCGFPANFFGGEQSMPLSERQLTMALLIAAICQAKRIVNINNKIIDLDLYAQEEIVRTFKNLYYNVEDYTTEFMRLYLKLANGIGNQQVGII